MNRCIFTTVCVLFCAAASELAVSSAAMGEVLFYDSFDTSEPNADVNFEIDNRTGGTYGGTGSITYNGYAVNLATQTVGVIDGDKKVLELYNPTIWPRPGDASRNYLWLDHNFSGSDSAGGLNVAYTVKQLVDATGSDTWHSVSFANSSSAANDDGNRPIFNGLWFNFRNDGTGQVREDGTVTMDYTWLEGGAGDIYHDLLFIIRGVDDDNPFDGLNQAEITLYVDGDEAFSYTTSAGFSTANNYIGLETTSGPDSLPNVIYYENFSIAQVPEPSVLALLACGLSGLLAYAWKKR